MLPLSLSVRPNTGEEGGVMDDDAAPAFEMAAVGVK